MVPLFQLPLLIVAYNSHYLGGGIKFPSIFYPPLPRGWCGSLISTSPSYCSIQSPLLGGGGGGIQFPRIFYPPSQYCQGVGVVPLFQLPLLIVAYNPHYLGGGGIKFPRIFYPPLPILSRGWCGSLISTSPYCSIQSPLFWGWDKIS